MMIELLFILVLFADGANNEASNINNITTSIRDRDQSTDQMDQMDGHADRSSNDTGERVKGLYGVLVAMDSILKNTFITETFCVIHFNGDHIANQKNQSLYHNIMNLTSYDPGALCDHLQPLPAINYTDAYILIQYDTSGCDLNTQTRQLASKYKGSKGVIIAVGSGINTNDVTYLNDTSMDQDYLIALIAERSIDTIERNFGDFSRLKVLVYSPPLQSLGYSFDFSLIVIWIISVFTVTVGSFWSGKIRASLYNRKKYELPEEHGQGDEPDDQKKGLEEEQFLNISPRWVFFFVMCMGCMLVALYFFFRYLVFIIIGLFILASTLSVFACWDAISSHLLPKRLTSITVPCCSQSKLYVYQIILLSMSISFSFTWFFNRKEGFSWILQDTLGVFFSINMLRTIRLPSFQICFILLSLLFFYDIFFVFMTPLLTSKGESVMVEVATGGGSSGGSNSDSGTYREQLPMVLRVPHLNLDDDSSDNPLEICFKGTRSYSLLGFGDILVPGLLVSYCHAFDLIYNVPYKLYFISTAIFYGLGLIATFFGLYFMSGIAQPALLYLVPFCLLPPIIISLLRKEFKYLWTGPGDGSRSRTHSEDEGPITHNVTEDLPINSNSTEQSSRHSEDGQTI